MRRAEDIMGCNVVRILEPGDFASVLETERSIRSKPCYLAEYGRHVEETIIYDREYRSLPVSYTHLDVYKRQVQRKGY